MLSPKEEIKKRADIVDVIAQFVHLKKAGRNFVGLCPFHAEKDPSFTVNPERQTFHCFGCKKGGDIFDFWMEYHGTTFKEALHDLGERYNVPINNVTSHVETNRYSKRKAIFAINKTALAYFKTILSTSPKAEPARQYLNKRNIDNKTASDFEIGYALDQWNGLTDILLKQNTNMALATEAGLVIPRKNGGYYDRFRGRIMFPIFDLRNQVIGFGGRVLDNTLPKYINTPESPVFHKGETLYGLNKAREAIRKKDMALIVEGYMDLLALMKNDITYAVATLGTALTPYHVRKLRGYTNRVVVVFDSDNAGKKAAMKTLPLFANEGMSASVLVLPDGHDPDTFLNEKGRKEFLLLLKNAAPMLDFYLTMEITGNNSEVETIRVLKDFFPVLSTLNSDALRSIYVRRFAEKTGLRESIIWSELQNFIRTGSVTRAANNINQRIHDSMDQKRITDLQILNLLIYHPETIKKMMEIDCRILLSDSAIKTIIDIIFEQYRQYNAYSPEGLMDIIDDESIRQQLREVLHKPFIVYSEEEVDQAVTELEQKTHRKRFLQSLKQAKGDIEAQNSLILSEFHS
ncbi:MAG: DNA primase [Deltaproteobacteria bacterium]|nr:DNA primase [Deltaproteobacteria bacterium]